MGGSLKRDDSCERPVPCALQWNVSTEPLTGPDTFAEVIKDHLLLESGCVVGAPGTGKSFLLAQVRDSLRAAGHNVVVLAPTNAAARQVSGCTCHAFCARVAKNETGFQGTILILSPIHIRRSRRFTPSIYLWTHLLDTTHTSNRPT